MRTWHALDGAVEVGAERARRRRCARLTVTVANTTPWAGDDREEALRQHVLLDPHRAARRGAALRLAHRPARRAARGRRGAARTSAPGRCSSASEGERDTLLSSPIILEDHPRIAPESPGDLFDGGEIDQMLVLNILA